MKLTIKSSNLKVTPETQEYFEKRLETLGRFFNIEHDSVQVHAELSRDTHHKKGEVFKAEVKLSSGSHHYFAKAEGYDLFGAIDLVKDELMREVKTNKEKRRSLFRRGATRIKSLLRLGRES
jgi:ribosomal subunit interface protein